MAPGIASAPCVASTDLGWLSLFVHHAEPSAHGSVLLARLQDYDVGCIMTARPDVFPRDGWVVDRADWRPRIQVDRTIERLARRRPSHTLLGHGLTAAVASADNVRSLGWGQPMI